MNRQSLEKKIGILNVENEGVHSEFKSEVRVFKH